jgi:hypothetical protein
MVLEGRFFDAAAPAGAPLPFRGTTHYYSSRFALQVVCTPKGV